MSAELIRAGKKIRLYGSLGSKRLRTSESNAGRVIKSSKPLFATLMEKFIPESQNTVTKYNRPLQLPTVVLSGMNL